MRDLRQKYVQNPEFERCFLVIGEMGAGKSFFVHQRMYIEDNYAPTWVVLVPANYDQIDFSAALLESIRQCSGINWPDLESVENFLKQWDASSALLSQVIVVCDDLSRFGLMYTNAYAASNGIVPMLLRQDVVSVALECFFTAKLSANFVHSDRSNNAF
jgi:hypothetical protein